jgi:hypothetical protein
MKIVAFVCPIAISLSFFGLTAIPQPAAFADARRMPFLSYQSKVPVTTSLAKMLTNGDFPVGYVLEQIFSPLVVYDGGRLEQLRDVARRCITSQHSPHYKGFGYGEWTKFVNDPRKTTKRILYVFPCCFQAST